jgi:subtilisin family serine protease
MESYIISLKDNIENMTECVCCIIDYLGEDNCFSTYYNYYHKYRLKTRDIDFKEYSPLAIHKKTSNVFQSPMIMSLADDFINSSFNKIEAGLTLDQINYLKTLDCVEEIRISPKLEIKTLSNQVGNNTKSSFVNNNPNTNCGLQAQNKDFENDTLNKLKIFNYLKSPDNTTYEYNYKEINKQEVDIIVIDDGINGNHQNFIIDGKNICKIDEQPNLPWQLSKLYSLAGQKFIAGNTPEGVSEQDPKFVSYFTPQLKSTQKDPPYDHGTHVAGIICGNNTGWIRSNKVNLYSIPLMGGLTAYHIIIELAVLNFHLYKIKNGIKTPTLINRSYGFTLQNNNLLSFSNFTKKYNEYPFLIYKNSLGNLLFKENGYLPFFLEIQKKMGIVNILSGGNDSELQLKWSDDPNNYFNYYLTNTSITNTEYYIYPYIPMETCIKEDLWTVGGLKLSELTYKNSYELNNAKIEINYDLIQTHLNNNLNNIYKILNENPPAIIVGSIGGQLYTLNYLNEKNVGFLSNYILSGSSAFGDALIYSSGNNIRSSVAYSSENVLSNNLYDNLSGTSMAAPNITGILSLYLMKLYFTLNKHLSVDKIMMNTDSYVQNYIETNLRNIYNNVDSKQHPNKNEYFYKDIQLINRLENINQIYPLSLSPLYKIYCPVLFYDKDFITVHLMPPNSNELIAVSFTTSGLVGNPSTITLRAQNVTGDVLVYKITKQPEYGNLTPTTKNDVYTYVPNKNKVDRFEYVVIDNTLTSLPGTVIINNYSQMDVSSISRIQGNFTFDDILYNGTVWTFGTITTDTFIEGTEYNILGNYKIDILN